MSGLNDREELRRLAEAFPDDLDWDSNTEPFFNGPSGESLGGGSDGTYAVYGKPFRLEGEDYDYDGPTYVERCGKDFAKFIVEARGAIIALLDELDSCKADAERYRWLCETFGQTKLPCSLERLLEERYGVESYVADYKNGVDQAVDHFRAQDEKNG